MREYLNQKALGIRRTGPVAANGGADHTDTAGVLKSCSAEVDAVLSPGVRPIVCVYTFLMKPNRYKVAATLLGGKYKMGVVGKSRPRVVGRIGRVDYTLTSTWALETHTETYGVIRKKKRKRYETSEGHVFHLRSVWLSQPCTIRRSIGEITAVSAVPGDTVSLTQEQQDLLDSAFYKWPGIEITNHGIEWVVAEKEQTAQELALIVEGLAGVLERLGKGRGRGVPRLRSKEPLRSMAEVASMLKKPLRLAGGKRVAEGGESEGAVPDPPSEDEGQISEE